MAETSALSRIQELNQLADIACSGLLALDILEVVRRGVKVNSLNRAYKDVGAVIELLKKLRNQIAHYDSLNGLSEHLPLVKAVIDEFMVTEKTDVLRKVADTITTLEEIAKHNKWDEDKIQIAKRLLRALSRLTIQKADELLGSTLVLERFYL
jgi:hypothetical protein